MPASQNSKASRSKGIFFSLFLALVALGLSFYVVLFIGLIIEAARGPLNPAESTHLSATFRHFALPFSIAIAVVVFVMTLRQAGKEKAKELKTF